jgi:hypothetical protein
MVRTAWLVGFFAVVSVGAGGAPATPATPVWTDVGPPGAGDLIAVASAQGTTLAIEKGGVVHVHTSAGLSRLETPKGVALLDVALSGGKDGWVTGDAGQTLRFDGKTLASVPSQSTRGYQVTAAAAPGRAAGIAGKKIQTWNGERWLPIGSAPEWKGLLAMAPLGRGFLAVGAGGLAVYVDGVGENIHGTTETTSSKLDLRAVVTCGSDAVAVGDGTMFRAKSGTWREGPAPPAPVVAAVAQCAGAKVAKLAAVAGAELLVLDVKKGTWTRTTVEPGAALTDVASFGKGLVVVGKAGLWRTTARWP